MITNFCLNYVVVLDFTNRHGAKVISYQLPAKRAQKYAKFVWKPRFFIIFLLLIRDNCYIMFVGEVKQKTAMCYLLSVARKSRKQYTILYYSSNKHTPLYPNALEMWYRKFLKKLMMTVWMNYMIFKNTHYITCSWKMKI